MIHKYWFRPKTIGYGASPSSWEGWAITGVYVAAVAIAAFVLLSSRSEAPSAGAWLVFIVLVLCLTAIFALFCKAKTEGEWRWRSGKDL
jgi:hypothetical protein